MVLVHGKIALLMIMMSYNVGQMKDSEEGWLFAFGFSLFDINLVLIFLPGHNYIANYHNIGDNSSARECTDTEGESYITKKSI